MEESKILLQTNTVLDDSLNVSKWVIKELLQNEAGEVGLRLRSVFLFNTIVKEIVLDNPSFKIEESEDMKKYLGIEISSYFYDFQESLPDINQVKGNILFKTVTHVGAFDFWDIVYFNIGVDHKKIQGLNFISYDSRIRPEYNSNNVLDLRNRRFENFNLNFLQAKQGNPNSFKEMFKSYYDYKH